MVWDLREHGPADPSQTVLLLPGGMCTAAFFDDLAKEPDLASVRLVAATLPGFGGTVPSAELTMEGWARAAGELATEVGCDVVVGHSVGANVALEMAALGLYSGPLVLLAPSFSRADEFKELAMLNRIGRVPGVGQLAWWAMIKNVGRVMKDAFPPGRRDFFVGEMQKNDPALCRRLVKNYFAYLDRHGSLVSRLCDTGLATWVVFGDHEEVGLADDERRGLETCPGVTLITIPEATHMMFVDQPEQSAQVILAALPVS